MARKILGAPPAQRGRGQEVVEVSWGVAVRVAPWRALGGEAGEA